MSEKFKIGNICNIKTGKLDANQFVLGGEYPFYTCAPEPLTIDSYSFDDSVILIAGNNAAGNFHINRFDGKFDAYQRTYILTAKPGFDLDYIFYSLKLELKRLKEKAQGSQTKFLTMPLLNDISIAKLDLSSQQKISSVLSALDSKIELNNKINSELEAMAKMLYDHWFVQFDFPFDFASTSLSTNAQCRPDKNGKPYKTSGGKMVWNEELKREIPDGWTSGTLLDLGAIVGGSTPPREIDDYFTTKGTAWITPKDLSLNTGNKFITKGELDVSDKGIKVASLNIMPKGTILLSSRAPIGYLAISREQVTTNQGFKSFVPKKSYTTEYVYYAIKNMIPTIENNSAGSTFKEVSGSTLKAIKICLPDTGIIKSYTSMEALAKPIKANGINSLKVKKRKFTCLK